MWTSFILQCWNRPIFSSHWGLTNEISAFRITLPLTNICLLNPLLPHSPYLTWPVIKYEITNTIQQQRSQVCLGCFDLLIYFLSNAQELISLTYLCVSNQTGARVSEIGFSIGRKTRTRVRRPCVGKPGELWGCFYSSYKSTNSSNGQYSFRATNEADLCHK